MGIVGNDPQDVKLITEQLNYMKKNKLDFTNTFREFGAHNPAVIPRNHRVEEALDAAESGDLTALQNLLEALRKPYEDSEIYSRSPEPNICKYRTFCGT